MLQIESLAFVVFIIINVAMIGATWGFVLTQSTFWHGFKAWLIGSFIHGAMWVIWLLIVSVIGGA